MTCGTPYSINEFAAWKDVSCAIAGKNLKISNRYLHLNNDWSNMRIVTVCVTGFPALRVSQNLERIQLLQRVIEEIKKRGWKPSVVLFPGGFFQLHTYIGHFDHQDRLSAIARRDFSSVCCQAAHDIDAVICVGIDSKGYWDQLCVAFDKNGIIGVGRKIFPVKGTESPWYISYLPDFYSKKRNILTTDGRALLLSCYDVYGCSESPKNMGPRSKNIQYLGDGENNEITRAGEREQFQEAIVKGLRSWAGKVGNSTMALAAVHLFRRQRRNRKSPDSGSGYFQRLGIENSSKFVGGGFIFGAAHFERLPKDPEKVVLASKDGMRLKTSDFFYWPNAKSPKVLVRFFQV
jgi:hypothetical protein